MTLRQQLALDLGASPTYAPDDFFLSESNEEANAWIERWPNWHHHCLMVYGPAGCGKTHLAHIWQQKSAARFVDSKMLAETNLEELCQSSNSLIVDDIERELLGEPLLHLFNLAKEHKGSLLLLADRAPARWKIDLPDLSSRILAAPNVAIKSPDDQLLRAVVFKLFSDNQIAVDKQIVDYMLPRIDRSFVSVQRIVSQILAANRKLTLSLVREVINKSS